MDNQAGIELMRKGNYEEAAKQFAAYIEENPKEPTGYINMGNLLAALNDFERALVFYERALELDHDATVAYYGIGCVHYQQENHQQAIQAFTEALTGGMNEADLFYMLGMSYYSEGKLAHAQANLSRAYELSSEDSEIVFQYG
ncbi:tetratricopeptide repeat protein, partial [Shouchella clausii]